MFRMSTFTEYTGEILTIKIKKKYKTENQFELFSDNKKRAINNPLESPFGVYKDVDGKEWDCQGRINQYILARPNRIDYFNDTSSMNEYVGIQSARWIPYNIEMVD